MNILVIDVGGTHVKLLATGQQQVRKLDSGPENDRRANGPRGARSDPRLVIRCGVHRLPRPRCRRQAAFGAENLRPGWVGFDFQQRFGRPVKIVNDAAMQALGSYSGGRMLFLGLGTGLGSALVIGKILVPLELAHLPYRKDRTFEDYVGLRGLQRLGKKRWRQAVDDVVGRLRMAFLSDDVVLGGGNAKLLKQLPPNTHLGSNRNAFVGGFRLWEEDVLVASPSQPSFAAPAAAAPQAS